MPISNLIHINTHFVGVLFGDLSQSYQMGHQKVKKAAELMDIKLLDHLILTEDAYYSFADEGILK